MSPQNVLAFINKVNDDPALQARIGSLPDGVKSLVKFAAASGFVFTAEEWNAAIAASSQTLSENELNQVAGGLVPAVQSPQLNGDGKPSANPNAFIWFERFSQK